MSRRHSLSVEREAHLQSIELLEIRGGQLIIRLYIGLDKYYCAASEFKEW